MLSGNQQEGWAVTRGAGAAATTACLPSTELTQPLHSSAPKFWEQRRMRAPQCCSALWVGCAAFAEIGTNSCSNTSVLHAPHGVINSINTAGCSRSHKKSNLQLCVRLHRTTTAQTLYNHCRTNHWRASQRSSTGPATAGQLGLEGS